MRFEHLEVERMRLHNAPRAVSFGSGITIVHGPNEAGKSTLLHAMRCAIVYDHGSKAETVRDLAPWGTSGLGPCVRLVFSHRGVCYRLVKRWLNAPSSELQQERDGVWEPLHGGAPADQFIRMLFAGENPGRNQSPLASHGGIGQLLFAPQRELRLEEDLNAGVRQQLRAVIGSVTESPETQRLRKRIAKRAEPYFTKTGQTAKNSPVAQAEVDVAAARQSAIEASARAQQLEELGDGLSEANEALTLYRGNLTQLERELAALKPQMDERRELEWQIGVLQEQRSGTQLEIDQALQRSELIAAERARLVRERAQAEAAAIQHQEAIERLEEARRRLTAAVLAQQRLEEERRGLSQLELRRAQRGRYEESAKRGSELESQLERVAALEQAVARVQAALEKVAPVDRDALDELERCIGDRARLVQRIDASAIRLSFSASRDVRILLADGERAVNAGESIVTAAEGRVALIIDGVGTLVATGPVEDLSNERRDLARAEARVAELSAALGAGDVDALTARAVVRERLEVELNGKRGALNAALGEETRESLTAARASNSATCAELLKTDSGLLEIDREALSAHIQAERDRVEGRQTTVTAELQEAQNALGSCEEEEKARAHGATQARDQTIECEARLETWEDGRSDEERERKRIDLAAKIQNIDAKLAALMRRYEELGDGLAERYGQMENEAAICRQQIEGAIARVGQYEALLKTLTAEAPSRRVAELQERVAEQERELARVRLEARALEILRETIEIADSESRARIVAPLHGLAAPWYRAIANRELGRLDLDEGYALTAIGLDGGLDVDPDDLSCGAQDQLALVVRLAFATLLAEQHEDKVLPCVLDDPLVHADELRRARALAVLKEAAQHLQVIVLTCDQRAYASLRDVAEFVEVG